MTDLNGSALTGAPLTNQPAPCDVTGFQRQLTLLGGELTDGRPKLRIVWGQDPLVTVFWKGEQRLRYLHHTDQIMTAWKSGDGKVFPPTVEPPAFEKTQSLIVEPVYQLKDIGIPRWYIEQMMPSTILGQGWSKIRYDYNFETGELEDSLGPIPSLGDYEEAFYMIADHSECCPENDFKVGCKGSYRPPQQHDIEYVRWLLNQLNQEAFRYTWEEIPPPEAIVQNLIEHKNNLLEDSAKKQMETDYAIRNSLLTHKGSIFGGTRTWDIGAAFNRARKF